MASPLAPSAAPAAAPPSAGPASFALQGVAHLLDAPVHSLALDPERGTVAALGAEPWLCDARSCKPIALPQALRPKSGERDDARIHFGRDHQPRIMGTRFGEAGPRQLYLRFRHGAWREEPRELASFAGKPHAALYGVLGIDDPEVVCKVGEFCLVKQRTGWSQVPLPVAAPERALRIDLGAGQTYALLQRQLLRLGKSSWVPAGDHGPWRNLPGGAWLSAAGGWVSVPTEGALYQLDGSTWRRHSSPVREPRGLWADVDGTLWIAGSDGVGRLRGAEPSRVAGIAGPVAELVGQGSTMWFGGAGGVWLGTVPHNR